MPIDYNLTVGELVEQGGQYKTPERVKSDKAYRNMKHYEDKRHFTQVNDKECSLVYKTISIELAGVLMNLFVYMELGESGKVKFDGKRIGAKELAKILGKSERKTKDYLVELESLGYIKSEKEGRRKVYSVSTQLATRGERMNKGYFTRLYLVRLRDALKVLTIQEAGLLFFMIPHMNTSTFVLCSNPYEINPDKVELWNRKQLTEACGLSLVQVKRLTASLMKKQVLIGVKTHRTAIILSPELISRNEKKVSTNDVAKILRNDLNGSGINW